jgi:hypothetical protein
MCSFDGTYVNDPPRDNRTTEQVMVAMMREDLGVEISAQAWRMFLRHRWERFTPLAHRIHEGKR